MQFAVEQVIFSSNFYMATGSERTAKTEAIVDETSEVHIPEALAPFMAHNTSQT